MNKFKSILYRKFNQLFAKLLIIEYICRTNLKANHNKDYSVVKTFKAGQLAFFL
jgi:hypothetical protein